jgi:phytoene dehydrogenase-like protein
MASSSDLDAVVIGSGPNGLAAAITLTRAGASVVVLEAAAEPGGGMRSAEFTEPGFLHDVCSAVHPMGVLSPFFRQLPLEEHGLVWIRPAASVAHPMPDGDAVLLYRSLPRTQERLGRDARAWASLVRPFLDSPHELLAAQHQQRMRRNAQRRHRVARSVASRPRRPASPRRDP